MDRLDLTECASRQREVHNAWIKQTKESMRRKSWMDRCRKYPDRFQIKRGYVWERDPKNPLGWTAIAFI